MSTICKLDRNVRLDRHLRRLQLREMQGDLKTITALVARGRKVVARASDAIKAATAKGLLADILLKQRVLAMVLAHLTHVARDPRRTGERKDAIFMKLGAVAE